MSWKTVKDEFTIKDIGAPLLANLSVGIYSHQDVLREYVQNACDAYEAMDQAPDEPDVHISVESGHTLMIQDNGVGMDLESIRACKKIAVSSKQAGAFTGFRGIGIWAGLQACEKLEVTTSTTGDPKRYKMIFAFDEIYKDVKKNNLDIGELLKDRVHLHEDDGTIAEHFTSVRLIGLKEGYRQLTTPAELRRIVSQLLPCRVDPKYEHAEEVTKFCRGSKGYREYAILIDGEEAFREFPDTEYGFKTEILKRDKVEYARAWYCSGKATLRPDSSNQIRNFRLRVKNFAVGEPGIYSASDGQPYGVSSDYARLQSPIHLQWHCGELHVTNPEVTPNTPRRELEPSRLAINTIELIRAFYGERINDSKDLADFNGIYRRLRAYAEGLQNGTLGPANIADAIADLQVQEKVVRGQSNEYGSLSKQLMSDAAEKKLRTKVLADLKQAQSATSSSADSSGPGHGSHSGAASRPSKGASGSAASRNGTAGKAGWASGSTGASNGTSAESGERLLSEIIAIIESKLADDDETQQEIITALQELFAEFGFIFGGERTEPGRAQSPKAAAGSRGKRGRG
jgi:hypothetical protein